MVSTAKAMSKGRRTRNQPPPGAWMAQRRLFTSDEYDRMIACGIVAEGERVELVEGEIVQMAAMGGPHLWCVVRLTGLFSAETAGRALLSVQCPILLAPGSEPEPDLTLLRIQADADTEALPGPDDVLLLIEVSDTTLAYDRDVKLKLCAEAGIPESWIVDITHQQVLVYRTPKDGQYTEASTAKRGASISPLAFPDLIIPVDGILG